jgi:hypothetical protein
MVWVGTALLPVIFHARFVGVFFLVSVPLLAAHLNAFARRASVISANHPSARPFGFVARFGRLFSVLVLASLIAMAVPGWLHPNFDLRALDRWVAWSVEPDEGMKRAGELIQGWRTDGTKGPLLAGVNGMLTHPDFGDYAAWFAPAEKPFLNSRYRLHRAELDDLIELRRWLIYRKPAEDSPRLTAILEKNSAEYVCLGQSMLNVPYLGVTAALDEFRSKESSAGGASGWDGLWHLDGRFAVVGRFDTTARIERSAALVWNVARNAFGPRDRVAVEEDAVIHVGEPPRVGWEHEFVLRPPLPPVELSDSTSYSLFSQVRQQVAVQVWQQRVEEWRGGTVRGLWLVGGGPLALQANLASPRAPEPQDIDFALPILAVQSARRAIQRDPDEPRGYNALSLAYTLEMLPQLQPGENRTQILTALTRAHARTPEPVEGERTRATAAGIEIEARLFKYHLMADIMQDQHVDLARAAVVNLSKLVRAANDEDLRYNPVFELWNIWIGVLRVELATRAQVPLETLPPTEQLLDVLVQQKMLDATDHPKQWQLKDETDVTREFVLDRLKKLETAVLEAIRRRNDIVERQSPETRFRNFIRFGLPGKAIEMFDGKQAKKENVTLEELQEYIGLLFAVGRLEQATDYRKKLEETVAKMADATDPRAPAIRQTHQHFELTEAKLAGNFKRAEMLLEEQFRSVAPPKLTPAEKAKLTLDTTSFALSIGALSGGWNCTFAYSEIALLKQRLYLESTFLFQRGMMALLNGDTALAKTHFDAASRPQGVELKAIGVPQDMPALPVYLPKYRELLDRYGTKR